MGNVKQKVISGGVAGATRLSVCHLCVPQCDSLKVELQELQVLYDSSQQERAELEEELQRCKAELEKLSGGAQVKKTTSV